MATKVPPSSSYVAPVQGQVRRLDQGVDFQGKAGDPVVAIGRAVVDYIKPDPGGFGKAIYYTLLDGPKKDQQFYVGHAQPIVHAGQVVGAGESVALLLAHGLGNAGNLSGWTEMGYAKNGAPLPNSAKSFHAFVSGLSQAAAPGIAESAPAVSMSAPSAGAAGAAAPSQFTAPLPLESGVAQPQALDPGTVPAGAANPQQFAETWQRIVADPWAPAGAANYAAMWQGG